MGWCWSVSPQEARVRYGLNMAAHAVSFMVGVKERLMRWMLTSLEIGGHSGGLADPRGARDAGGRDGR